MKKLIAILLLLITGFAHGQATDGGTIGGGLWITRRIPVFSGTAASDSGWAIVHLPSNYAANPTKKFRVIISDHGDGQGATNETNRETGANISLLLGDGLPYMITQGLAHPGAYNDSFIVIATQYYQPSAEPYYYDQFMYNYLKTQYRFNDSAVYLSGYSYGGYCIYDKYTNNYDTTAGDMYAALLIQSAATLESYRLPRLSYIGLRNIPIWGMTGTADGFYTTDTSYVDSVNKTIPTPCTHSPYTTRPGLGHSSAVWDSASSNTYRPAELGGKNPYEWLYQFTTNRCDTAITPVTPTAPAPKYVISLGEYNSSILVSATHKAYGFAGVPYTIAGTPSYVSTLSAGTHGSTFVDSMGNVFNRGDDNNYGELGIGTTTLPARTDSCYPIPVDSLGNTFTGITKVINSGSFAGFTQVALKANGTVYIWGNTQTGLEGNNTWGAAASTRPVQIPYSVPISDIRFGGIVMALDTSGALWVHGGGGTYAPYLNPQGTYSPTYSVPTKITLETGQKVVKIAGGGNWNYAELANGHWYGWGQFAGYLGIGAASDSVYNHPSASITPTRVDTAWNFPYPIMEIATSDMATYVILTDSSLWGWGDNATGALGIGSELNYATYMNGGTPAPYNWNQAPGQFFIRKPIQIGKGIHFAHIWVKPCLNFDAMFSDGQGNVYGCGRNKGFVLFNGQGSCDATGSQSATYPNSWDIPLLTAFPDPFAVSKVLVVSPECATNPTATYCSLCSGRVSTAPTVSAGINQNLSSGTTASTLSGLATPAGSGSIIRWVWTQLSGPNLPTITLVSGQSASLTGLTNGTYQFQLAATDNSQNTASATMTIVIGGSTPLPSTHLSFPKRLILH